MTQSPQKTYLGLKYKIILEQPERKFALSDSELNVFIMNPEETIILEYVHAPYYKLERCDLFELYGKCLNGVQEVLVSADNIELPIFCQIKIRRYRETITKNYKFAKINRIEV